MVATWKTSWLTESGTRVLYILPRKWTDETLPLQLDPRPEQLERVMVGRAELITPAIESELQALYVALDRGTIGRAEGVRHLADLELGRFTEPALSRLKALRYMRIDRDVNRLSSEVQLFSGAPAETRTLAHAADTD